MYVCNITCGMFLGLTIWCQITNWSPADFHLGLRPGQLSHILAHLLSSSLSSCLVVMLVRLYGVASDIPSRQLHSKLGSSASYSLSNPSIMIPEPSVQELCCGCLSWNSTTLPFELLWFSATFSVLQREISLMRVSTTLICWQRDTFRVQLWIVLVQ